MPRRPGSPFSAVPPRLVGPISVIATVVTALGTGLIMTATALGAWSAVLVAASCFTVAGVLWHAADHASH